MEDSDGGLQDFDFEQGLEASQAQGTTQQRSTFGLPANTGHVPAQSGGGQHGGNGPFSRPYRKNFRQTVCRHWLRGLCMKGSDCGFLHQYDKSRMPVCRFFAKWGECREQDCIYKHTNEDIKECNMYKLGFCPNGPECRYRHQKQPGPPPPPETHLQRLQHRIFSNGVYSRPRQGDAQEGLGQGLSRQGLHGHHEDVFASADRRISTELGLPVPESSSVQQQKQYQDMQVQQQQLSAVHPAGQPQQAEAVASSLALPLPQGVSRYFIVKSNNMENLELSVQRGLWATHRNNEIRINGAYDSCDNIILIFSINETRHFQGCAKMMSKIGAGDNAAEWKHANGTTAVYGRNFRVKWLKLCQLSFQKTRHLRNPWKDDLPVKISRDCQELEPTVGEQLAQLLYTEPDSELMATARASDKARQEAQAKGGPNGRSEMNKAKVVVGDVKAADEESDEYEEDGDDDDDEETSPSMRPASLVHGGRPPGARGVAAAAGNGVGGMPGSGAFGAPRGGPVGGFAAVRPPGLSYGDVPPDFPGPEFPGPGPGPHFGRHFAQPDFYRPDYPPRPPYPAPDFGGPGPGFGGPEFIPRPDFGGNGFGGPPMGFGPMGMLGPGMLHGAPGPSGAFMLAGSGMMGGDGRWEAPGMMGAPGPLPFGGQGPPNRLPYMRGDGPPIRPYSATGSRPALANGRRGPRDGPPSHQAKRPRVDERDNGDRPGRLAGNPGYLQPVEDGGGAHGRSTSKEAGRTAKHQGESSREGGSQRKEEEEASENEGPKRSRYPKRDWEEEDEDEAWDDGMDIVDPWEAARQAETANMEGGED